MLSKKIKEITNVRAKLAALEEEVAKQRKAALSVLHKEFGFESIEDLIEALKELVGAKPARGRGRKKGAAGRPAKKAAKKAAARGEGKKRKRAKVTPEMREQIIEAVKAGKTGKAIAAEFGVSLPTVQNIKRDAGLTKARGQ